MSKNKFLFGFDKEPDPDLFSRATRDFAKLLLSVPEIKIAGWDGSGTPTIEEKKVLFNGSGEEACETFDISCRVFSFTCDTGGKKYDFLVRCCLIIFSHYCPEFHVSYTDKSFVEGSKWMDAKKWIYCHLRYGKDFGAEKKESRQISRKVVKSEA